MRAPELRLKDILEAADAIHEFIEQIETFENFERSLLYRSAIALQLVIIGEASGQVDDEYRAKHPEIPWDKLKRFRNFVVHQYFGVDYQEVWNSALRVTSEIEDQIIKIMEQDFPDF